MPERQEADQSQAAYTETAYQDASWEVLDDTRLSEEFLPMEVDILGSDQRKTDRMFADFGGGIKQDGPRRFHLPEHLAQQARDQGTLQQEEQAKKKAFSEEELNSLQQQWLQQGLEQGLQQASEAEQQKRTQLEQHLAATLRDLNSQIQQNMEAIEKETVKLAVKISQKIIEGAVEINPEYILKVVSDALALSGGAAVTKVRVSQQDMEFIEYIGAARHLKEYNGSWTFEVDAGIKAGCVVETSAGEIDYQLDKAWERVRESVLKVIK
jgi:flagellar assembly protein FliH